MHQHALWRPPSCYAGILNSNLPNGKSIGNTLIHIGTSGNHKVLPEMVYVKCFVKCSAYSVLLIIFGCQNQDKTNHIG